VSKGQAGLDIVTFIVIIFFLALLSLIAVKIWNGMNSNFQGNPALPAASQAAAATTATNLPAGLDVAIVVALGLLYIGLFVTTSRIGTDPMFFFINVCLIVVVLGMGAIFGNVYDQGTNTADFVVERASMPASVYIASHLLEFSIGAAAIILIGLFAKPGGSK
jgi:hypothetical protein